MLKTLSFQEHIWRVQGGNFQCVDVSFPSHMQAVLAHELGHLKCDHGVWLTFANILTVGAYSVPGKFYFVRSVDIFRLGMKIVKNGQLCDYPIHRYWWFYCSTIRRTAFPLASGSRTYL